MTDQQAEGAEEQFKITSITVGWTQTQSLPDYCNVKPSISITAQIKEIDNPGKVADLLIVACQDFVHAHIDTALEERNRPALYSKEQRFTLWSTRVAQRKYGIIIPDGEEPPVEAFTAWKVLGGLRMAHMQDYAGQQDYAYLFRNLEEALKVIPALQAEYDFQRSQPLEVAPISLLDEEEPEEEDGNDEPEEVGGQSLYTTLFSEEEPTLRGPSPDEQAALAEGLAIFEAHRDRLWTVRQGQQEELEKNAAQIDLLTKRMQERMDSSAMPMSRSEIQAELEQLAATSDSVDQEEVTNPTAGLIVLSRVMSALDQKMKAEGWADRGPDIKL